MTYTDGEEIADALGLDWATLGGAQQSLADLCAAAATAYLEGATGRSWGGPATVTAEQHTLDGPIVYLRQRPVVGVDTVTIRDPYLGSTPTTLAAGTGYELIDAAAGQLSLLGSTDVLTRDVLLGHDQPAAWYGWLLSVTYRYSAPVPADIRLAALELGSDAYARLRAGDARTLRTLSVADVSVTFADTAPGSPVVAQAVRHHKRLVFA